MSDLCVYCGKRRGTRYCPALGGTICSRCCGENRLVRIDCPSTCPHLKRNESFQRDKQKARYREAWGRVNADLRQREEDLRLLLAIEGVVFRAAERMKGITDADIATALADLRSQLSPIEIITHSPSVLARLLLEEMNDLLAGESLMRVRVRELLPRLEKMLDTLRDPTTPRAFLQGLAAHLKQFGVEVEGNKRSFILTPDDFASSG